MMSGNQSFGNFSSSRQVDAAVRVWNGEADAQDDIYYKVFYQCSIFLGLISFCTACRTAEGLLQRRLADKHEYQANKIHDSQRPCPGIIYDLKQLEFTPAIPEATLKAHHVPRPGTNQWGSYDKYLSFYTVKNGKPWTREI
jgi:hypothetical protein